MFVTVITPIEINGLKFNCSNKFHIASNGDVSREDWEVDGDISYMESELNHHQLERLFDFNESIGVGWRAIISDKLEDMFDSATVADLLEKYTVAMCGE
jgi:hypothetical protein